MVIHTLHQQPLAFQQAKGLKRTSFKRDVQKLPYSSYRVRYYPCLSRKTGSKKYFDRIMIRANTVLNNYGV